MRSELKLPSSIAEPLRKVAKVLYHRFEFSRCNDTASSPFGTCITVEYDNRDDRVTEDMFPRISRRAKFLDTTQPTTYLNDLKTDVEQRGEDAKNFLISHVEDWNAPLCPYSSILCSRRLDPFFPRELQDDEKLLAYIRQLFSLQEYLFDELGAKAGSLLPVWLLKDQPGNGLPRIGVLPVRQSTVNAFLAYILWEQKQDFTAYLYEPPFGDKNNDEFLDNALRYGRLKAWCFIRDNDINERTDEPYLWVTHERKTIMKRIGNMLPKHLADAPTSWAKEVLKDLEERGEIARQTIRVGFESEDTIDTKYATPEEIKRHNARIVQTSEFMSRVDRAAEKGQAMYDGAYRNYW